MLTVLEVIKKTAGFLEGKGIEAARFNAELLVGSALGLRRMDLYLQFERPLSEAELERIRLLVRRRGRREPAAYIVGRADFHGLTLKLDRRALIPRPETELLVELILERRPEGAGAVLDLGTGSGAIALALAAAWPSAAVTAVDVSPEALELARENAGETGLSGRVTFLRSDWFAGLAAGSRYDVIAANPPYLSARETAEAAPEVREHEPRLALAAEEEGLAALRQIVEAAPRFLAPGGLLALETGPGHHPALLAAAARAGLTAAESVRDLAGRDRFVFARG